MERYSGVRFKVQFLRRVAPSGEKIKELSDWCKEFHLHGLAPVYEEKSKGNLSFRVREGVEEFIITGSGLGPKDSLGPRCFVKVIGHDPEKGVVYASGTREPSSESMLHGRIYEAREDVNAIFHGHDPLILKCSKALGFVETKEWCPYGSFELIEAVEEVLDGNDFIIIKDHGFLSLGRGRGAMKKAGVLALERKELCENMAMV